MACGNELVLNEHDLRANVSKERRTQRRRRPLSLRTFRLICIAVWPQCIWRRSRYAAIPLAAKVPRNKTTRFFLSRTCDANLRAADADAAVASFRQYSNNVTSRLIPIVKVRLGFQDEMGQHSIYIYYLLLIVINTTLVSNAN